LGITFTSFSETELYYHIRPRCGKRKNIVGRAAENANAETYLFMILLKTVRSIDIFFEQVENKPDGYDLPQWLQKNPGNRVGLRLYFHKDSLGGFF